jgi:hypothetical protein
VHYGPKEPRQAVVCNVLHDNFHNVRILQKQTN